MRLMLFRGYIKIVNFFRSFGMCHKEYLGYRCKHATYADGTKECGEW